jgi:C-terminal processing protease CtpA/Prc
VAGDFGMNVSYFKTEDNLRVMSVEKFSAAGRAGVHRGWKISKINGNSNISFSNKDVVNKAVYNSTSTLFTFQKPDNSVVDITLRAGGYIETPLFLDTVYSIGNKKIGYMVFNSFLGDTAEVYKRFNTVFNKFSGQDVKDLVIDLRYNGGGYVSVQEKLANYLVNPSANGKVMMKQVFNDKLSQYNETTYFKKTGTLNPARILFIVSGNTASASELLINSLKPYVETKLVGPSNTHGKPVGFFPHPVLDWYIFPVSFRTVNSNGQGNYFGGMVPDNKASDGIDKDWGDLEEASLASAIRYITGGAFRSKEGDLFVESPLATEANKTFEARLFKGSIDTRRMN